MRFFGKVLIAVLSTILFSLSLAFFEYTPSEKQEANVGYFSFTGLFIIYFIYSLPINRRITIEKNNTYLIRYVGEPRAA